MANLDHLIIESLTDFNACAGMPALENAKAKYLGKTGALTDALKGLGRLSNEERPAAGAAINVVKQAIESVLNARREAILNGALAFIGAGIYRRNDARTRAIARWFASSAVDSVRF